MKTDGRGEELNTLNLQSKSLNETPAREIKTSSVAYHELPSLRHETRDVLKQLDSNIQLLEDLNGRMGFMLTELRSLIRR